MGKKTGHSRALKPFGSAIKGATTNLERSLRKLNVVKRNISTTILTDQLTQVDSNYQSSNNKNTTGDAEFDQIDFTQAGSLHSK